MIVQIYQCIYIIKIIRYVDISSAVMQHHGGDGGADPPPDPTQIQADFERGNTYWVNLFMCIYLLITIWILYITYHGSHSLQSTKIHFLMIDVAYPYYLITSNQLIMFKETLYILIISRELLDHSTLYNHTFWSN